MPLVESTVAGRQANVRKRSLKVSVSADVKIQTIDGIFAHHCLAGRGPIESARPGCLREGRRRALRVKVLHRNACIKDG